MLILFTKKILIFVIFYLFKDKIMFNFIIDNE